MKLNKAQKEYSKAFHSVDYKNIPKNIMNLSIELLSIICIKNSDGRSEAEWLWTNTNWLDDKEIFVFKDKTIRQTLIELAKHVNKNFKRR